MGLDYYKSLRILALRDVVSETPSSDYSIRRIMRWYSRTFATPLHEVEDLPLHDVMTAYYEATYEAMDAEDRQAEIEDLSASPEQIRQKKIDAELDELSTWRFEKSVAKEVAQTEALTEAEKQRTENKKTRIQQEERRQAEKLMAELGITSSNIRAQRPPVKSDVVPGDEFSMDFLDLEEASEADLDSIPPLVDLK